MNGPQIVPESDRPRRTDGNGGGNGRIDGIEARLQAVEERLRLVELDVREIKTRLEDVARKSDIEKATDRLKIWALGGSLIGTSAVIGWLVYFFKS